MQLIDELIEKVSTIVQETQDSIIIDAIYPFAQTVEYRISKEELREAILKYYGKHDPVKHGAYSKNEMIECLAQIGQRYGDLYMTMFGCTCDIKDYVNRIIVRINEEVDVVDE